MEIKMRKVKVSDLTKGFQDNKEGGVKGLNGKLDIRPPYQREFVYKDKQRDAVIDTVNKGYPLNVMYWAVKHDGTFEVIDGQQRTISLCQFVNGDFSFNNLYFHNLKADQVKKLMDYELTVYLCSGTETERLNWFKTINIAGEKLYEQELRNAVYSGPWVSDAKRYFSRTNCPAFGLAGRYMAGNPIRQDYLETVISWINNGKIEDYMALHQHDGDAKAEWTYFKNVIEWVTGTFIEYRSEMKGIDWGIYFNKYRKQKLNPQELEKQVSRLMQDDDVTNKRGIYLYLLDKDERNLNIRNFDKKQKREAFERQNGICPKCNGKFLFEEMEGDHIKPWSKGGKTEADNCQMLCEDDNRRKSNI